MNKPVQSQNSMSDTLTEPLGLQRFRKSPRPLFPFLALVDFCAIGTLFLMFSTRFIFTPGLNLELPLGEGIVTEGVSAMGVLTVLSGEGVDKLLFEGRIYSSLDDPAFAEGLEEFAHKHSSLSSMLLVKLDRSTSMQTFFQICRIARKSGIDRIHIASEVKP